MCPQSSSRYHRHHDRHTATNVTRTRVNHSNGLVASERVSSLRRSPQGQVALCWLLSRKISGRSTSSATWTPRQTITISALGPRRMIPSRCTTSTRDCCPSRGRHHGKRTRPPRLRRHLWSSTRASPESRQTRSGHRRSRFRSSRPSATRYFRALGLFVDGVGPDTIYVAKLLPHAVTDTAEQSWAECYDLIDYQVMMSAKYDSVAKTARGVRAVMAAGQLQLRWSSGRSSARVQAMVRRVDSASRP
jgi:hypothetical protein